MIRNLWCVPVCLIAGSCLASASTPSNSFLTPSPQSWFWNWFRLLPGGSPESSPLQVEQAPAVCVIQPLGAIEDESAQAFEASVGSAGVVEMDGLHPATSKALWRFQQIVRTAGGTLTVTSAFRPSPYQDHLQEVWDKWNLELKDNTAEECQTLRAEVQQEYDRHALLDSQRPAPFSDHTRGLAFDAVVMLPKRTRSKRRVSTDLLARKAGLYRPHIQRDPVHFRLGS